MGRTYLLLAPVWERHPQLDPGRHRDALGLAHRSTPLADEPEDMRSLLPELQAAGSRAATAMEAQLPGSAARIRALLPESSSAVGGGSRAEGRLRRPSSRHASQATAQCSLGREEKQREA
jgi:hypothetical protein